MAGRPIPQRRGARRGEGARWLAVALLCGVALVWSTPLLWMLVAAFRPQNFGGLDMASLWPDFTPTLANFAEALDSADFALLYLNTVIVCLGILAVQLATITLAGYAFARLRFPGRELVFYGFLLQLMLVPPILIVPNLTTVTELGLYDDLLGVMAPYFASAFGVFLMRQTFRTIPRDFEEAAIVDGATWWQLIVRVLVPLARPGMIAFGIVSVVTHWNEFLWPLMVISSPGNQTLTVGLASFTMGAESASQWGVIAAGTFLVAAPLLLAFGLFQRQFVNSFLFSGIK
ncbi:carbohydrate ABC transporter membrane protein 2, CUT1 family [Tistlia consotensis]|uniref:Carbohydrate ABC transporter membrane protein 2, CUT1 family n=1 Tax=Tistlia consotensis USBA 355 TaxID=560819 RepID=A0A1Y6B3M4_9PROT|nr:carbohydrate ABC transporter permease [Tistlia consotensis]SME89812.1 carbohydrate ABC transporter membrane protein 2, CUT1 family [Tistlia consotensis USBA 355]SNR26320.1 carbohydrate ABC transporter membrane protein 2, CUT1 family [Tistlia consotensis]